MCWLVYTNSTVSRGRQSDNTSEDMRTRSKAKTVITTLDGEDEESDNIMPSLTKMDGSIEKKSTRRPSVRHRSRSQSKKVENPMKQKIPTRRQGSTLSIQEQLSKLSTKFPNTVPASHPDTPEYAKYKYIELGYRVGYSVYECFLSLFTFHNEILNIWSHLIALIAWIALFALYTADYIQSASMQSSSSYINDMGLYGMSGNDTDFILLTLYMFVGGCVYFFSVVYHTFGSLNEPCHDCLLKFDLMGICLLLFGSYFPFFFYAFHCQPVLQQMYLALTLCTLPAGSLVAW